MTGGRRLRLLAVIASSELGGAERVLASLLKGFDQRRFELFVACQGEGPMLDEYRRHATDVRVMDLVKIRDPASVVAAARVMRRLRCEIVHTHLWTADVIGGLAAALARVPIRVATVHGAYFQVVDERGARRARKTALSATYRATYRLFDRVIAVSQHTADDLVARAGLRVDARRLTVVRNGMDLERVPISGLPVDRSALGVSATGPVVATVANFVPVKGHRWLVEAMPRVLRQFPETTLLLAGGGAGLSTLHRLVAAANLTRHVRFLGPRRDAFELLAASDVVVIPSILEGGSIVMLEALALARPVVATRVGGLPEVIQDGVNGLLVPARNAPALADAICAMLANPARARAMGEAGREVVRSRCSLEDMVRQTEQVYLDLAVGKGILPPGT